MNFKSLFISVLILLMSFNNVLNAQDLKQADSIKVDVTQNKIATKKDDKMKTLFSGVNNPIKKVKYWGISVSPEFQYSGLAGAYTLMAGFSGMLQLNKKLGIGLAGYSTVDKFTPTSLSKLNTRNLSAAYGGFKLEYTPNPNSAVHISFPLLIGGGMARIDSAAFYERNRGFGGGKNGRDGNDNYDRNGRGGTGFVVIQPGINLESNVFRFVKVHAGASYRIATAVESNAVLSTNLYGSPTASQLSGLNLSLGAKVGIFDYQFGQRKGNRMKKQRGIQSKQ